MPLKYPNARLFMHDLLCRERLSGAQALAAGACCFDLIPAQSVSGILAGPFHQDCRCMDVGEEIVKKHFEHRSNEQSLSTVDPTMVWKAIEKQVMRQPEAVTLSLKHPDAEPPAAHVCHHHVPALFDVMLQQLNRY